MKKKAKTILSMLLVVIMAVTLEPQSLLETVGVNSNVDAETTLSNPRIMEDSSMAAGQKVTWDCVWFGEYPQTEIVDQASTSGCYGKNWTSDSDYEVNASLYTALQSAAYDSNGDTTIGNTKYRRIQESDATYSVSDSLFYFNWTDSDTYHYFRYDPIKWRVLNVSDGKALLLADKALDDQPYNTTDASITWRESTIRSWLNGISSKNFIYSAFSSSEQNAILSTSVVNDDNLSSGTEGGYTTTDKIFLLSESEVYNTDTAKSYGFVSNSSTYDEARRSKSTLFAKAMGTYGDIYRTSSVGDCWWWLRSPGNNAYNAANVLDSGNVSYLGSSVTCYTAGCRPALNLNLSSNNFSCAGIVCSDGTVDEDATPGSIAHIHSWGTGEITKQPTCTEPGIRIYTCSICAKTKNEDISATGHVNKEVRNVKSATCKEEGYTGDTYCKTCGTKISTGKSIPKLTTHTYGAWNVTQSATVFVEGTQTGTCSVCGNTETQSIPNLTPTITLSKTKLTLKRKKTTTIKVSNLAAGDSVKSWKSTKKKVATVNAKGKIKAKKKGKTNIIVTLASGKTAVVKVTVK